MIIPQKGRKRGRSPFILARIPESSKNRSYTQLVTLPSLSGTITATDLPTDIDESFSVYELRPKDLTPAPTVLRSEADLNSFRIAYQQVLGTIVRDHGLIDAVHLFPAVPAPVAILCGLELLPKVHPSLVVYDYDKAKAGFTSQLRINQL
jgi:hypothetical protein